MLRTEESSSHFTSALTTYIHAFYAKIPQAIILSGINPYMYLAGVKVGSKGLLFKTFAICPYTELYTQFISRDDFELIDRKTLTPLELGREFIPHEHEELKWYDGPGPGYSWETAQELLTNRYTNSIKSIHLTLPQLLKREEFRAIIRKLKEEGNLDWQILLMISQISINYRVNRLISSGPWTRARMKSVEAKTKELMFRDEQEDDIEIPHQIFRKEKFDVQKQFLVGAVAKTWGIEFHRATTDFNALAKLLNVRYNNATDDIEHEDFFSVV